MDETRRVKEPARPLDPRSEFRRDRDRVPYSPHFARLAEITQVVSPDRGYVFHDRLTHSIKVAQIARTIAEKLAQQHAAACDALGGIDANAAEAAGLAHDLGHPPFGHIAAKELDRLVRQAGLPDGYEGNAWTIDDEAAVPVAGLNLTGSTLAGIIKYPWAVGENAEKPDKGGSTRKSASTSSRRERGLVHCNARSLQRSWSRLRLRSSVISASRARKEPGKK